MFTYVIDRQRCYAASVHHGMIASVMLRPACVHDSALLTTKTPTGERHEDSVF